jgi:hypothetical protein
MIQPETWKAIHDDVKAGWVVVGPLAYALVGLLTGAWITRHNQREQWIAENKKQEYRELQTALIRALSAILDHNAALRRGDEARVEEITQIYFHCLRTLRDRIYIAEEVEREGFSEKFSTPVSNYIRGGPVSDVEVATNAIMARIVELATKSS